MIVDFEVEHGNYEDLAPATRNAVARRLVESDLNDRSLVVVARTETRKIVGCAAVEHAEVDGYRALYIEVKADVEEARQPLIDVAQALVRHKKRRIIVSN